MDRSEYSSEDGTPPLQDYIHQYVTKALPGFAGCHKRELANSPLSSVQLQTTVCAATMV